MTREDGVLYHVHMNTKTTLSITEARKRIFEIADAVQRPDTYYFLTEKGRPKAVIMSAEEFESWRETLEVIEECPDLYKDIKGTEQEITTEQYKTYITLDEYLAQKGYVIADKAKKNYEASRPIQTTSRKRIKKTA